MKLYKVNQFVGETKTELLWLNGFGNGGERGYAWALEATIGDCSGRSREQWVGSEA